MELLAYIQEEFVNPDEAIALSSSNSSINLPFQTWLKNLTTKSVKLSLNVILASTTIILGLGTTFNATAQTNSSSSDVRYVQSLLNKNGFNVGAIDGVAGSSTKNAIIRAQRSLGLTPDGVAGNRTIAALEDGASTSKTEAATIESVVAPSSTVMNLQKLLADRGFYNGVVDGLMGTQTRAAILAAQRTYKLTPDGVAGPRTLAALESDGTIDSITPISLTSNITTSNVIKSAETANLQELLKKRGFYNGAIDGIMGPQSRLAIVAAQKNYGLATDGIAGSQTIAALESGTRNVNVAARSIEPASRAAAAITDAKVSDKNVVVLQQLLSQRGFYKGAIDGVKGTQTSKAIVAAQSAYGLTPDGIAGVQTIAALQSGRRLPASVTLAPINNESVKTPTTSNAVNYDDVANLQNLLADRGFYKGQITGFLGPITKEAIATAQKAYGLPADGIAGSRTIAALEAGGPAIRQQVVVRTANPSVTPTVRVQPSPQVTPAQPPELQPKIRVEQPQPTTQNAPKAQPTVAAQPTVQPTVAAAQPKQPTASDAQILELQRLLTQRGFYNGKADGVLSAETRNSIVRAQNFYIINPADGSPSNKLIESLSKDQFISSEGNN